MMDETEEDNQAVDLTISDDSESTTEDQNPPVDPTSIDEETNDDLADEEQDTENGNDPDVSIEIEEIDEPEVQDPITPT